MEDVTKLLKNVSFKDSNEHSKYINERIERYIKKDKWNTLITNTSHKDIIRDFGSCVFTNLVRDFFTKSYLKQHNCIICNNKAEQRCHGVGEGRLELIRRVLEKIYPDTTKTIKLKVIIIAFLFFLKYTKFNFKCEKCHKIETYDSSPEPEPEPEL